MRKKSDNLEIICIQTGPSQPRIKTNLDPNWTQITPEFDQTRHQNGIQIQQK